MRFIFYITLYFKNVFTSSYLLTLNKALTEKSYKTLFLKPFFSFTFPTQLCFQNKLTLQDWLTHLYFLQVHDESYALQQAQQFYR